jgi:hypothetical protein
MSQKSTEINKNDIPVEYEVVLSGDSYVFEKTLEDILEKYGLEAYHKYLIDGRIPKEGEMNDR